MLQRENVIGIDAGGTLIKLVNIAHENEIEGRSYPTSQMHIAVDWLLERGQAAPIHAIGITGGKAEVLKERLLAAYGHDHAPSIVIENEFVATSAGVKYLLRQEGHRLDRFLLTNVGTGTSIHIITEDESKRVGGTGVGGGTLMGLAALFSGLTHYEEIAQLALRGRRELVDLTVADIYEGATPPIPGNLTASNFGSVQLHPERETADVVAAAIGLVGETVTTVSVHAAGQYGAPVIVYVGSTFSGNALLQEIVARYTKLRGSSAIFLRQGEYCGAVGALLLI